jgi:hypothetical protein
MTNNFFKRVLFYIQRHSYNVQLRTTEAAILKFFLPKGKYNNSIHALNTNKRDSEIFCDLKNDGFVDLGISISDAQIDSIINELKKVKCYDFAKPGEHAVDINNVSKEVQLAHYKRKDLAQIPQIIKIANDSKVLNAVTKYLGVQPTISNINCWWSFGDRESAKEAQFYHRDLDDYKFLKMFIYLTDVSENSGPHIYIKRSHKSNKLNKLRRFNDLEVNEQFKRADILTLTKPKGNTFIEDTYGIHKGQLPKNGNRLILQIQYSYFPLHVENYEPVKNNLIEELNIDKYINRLLFKKN